MGAREAGRSRSDLYAAGLNEAVQAPIEHNVLLALTVHVHVGHRSECLSS